jgi:hypothetical protein
MHYVTTDKLKHSACVHHREFCDVFPSLFLFAEAALRPSPQASKPLTQFISRDSWNVVFTLQVYNETLLLSKLKPVPIFWRYCVITLRHTYMFSSYTPIAHRSGRTA